MNHNLPDGYTTRRLELSDADAVAEMINANSLATIGVLITSAEEFHTYWQMPGFDLTRDAIFIEDADGKTAAYGDVDDLNDLHVRIFTYGVVHPQHVGLGLGSYLVDWSIERGCSGLWRAHEGARVVLVQTLPAQEQAGRHLLESRGFAHLRVTYLMRLEMNDEPAAPEIPAGITIRPINLDTEFEAAVRNIQTAFRDHYGFIEEPIEQAVERWQHTTSTSPHFDPSVWYLALDGSEIVGVCYCTPFMDEDPETAFVNTLCVLREWRGLGIAHTLLRTCFVEFYRRGFRKVALAVDGQSLTGATRLYEKAGMYVYREYWRYEKEIRPGFDMVIRS